MLVVYAVLLRRYLGAYGVDMVRFNGKLARVVQPFAGVREGPVVPELADASKSVQVLFETKPIVEEGAIQPDVRARVVMRPAEIYVTAPGINRISGFFAAPKSEVIDFNALKDAASHVAERQVGFVVSVETMVVMNLTRLIVFCRVGQECRILWKIEKSWIYLFISPPHLSLFRPRTPRAIRPCASSLTWELCELTRSCKTAVVI